MRLPPAGGDCDPVCRVEGAGVCGMTVLGFGGIARVWILVLAAGVTQGFRYRVTR